MPVPNLQAAPAPLLAALREMREQPDVARDSLTALGLHALDGARNNLVYRHQPEGEAEPSIIKLYYKTDERRRVERESAALTLLTQHGVARVPRLLWQDEHPRTPALGMTVMPGIPLPELTNPASALPGFVATWQRIHAVAPTGLLAGLPRIDDSSHFIARLTGQWPDQLAQSEGDPQTPEMLQLLKAWQHSGDADVLAVAQPAAFSRGDANLLNWLAHGDEVAAVDFEFAGYSDAAYDVAELVEHISARVIDDEAWARVVPDLGVTTPAQRSRYQAAARTVALRWLAVLWKQRFKRADEFTAQLERVHRLQRGQSPLSDLV